MSWCPHGTCRSSGSFSARSLFTGVSNKLYVGRVVSKQEGRRSLMTKVIIRTKKEVDTVSLRFLKDCETTKSKITFSHWRNLFLNIILYLPRSVDCQTVLRGWVPLHLARVVVSIILINEVYLRHMMIILDHIWEQPWSCYVELTPPSGWWVASATPQKKSRQSCWTFKIVLAHFSDKTHINKKGNIWRRKKMSIKMKTWKPRWVVSTLSFHEWLHHPWKNEVVDYHGLTGIPSQ